MQKKILVVVAHPDDESFGLGGTLAKYAKEGVEIHVLCATRGENGQKGSKLGQKREQELLTASKTLGVARVEFMDFVDGTLSNNMYHEMAAKVEAKIKPFAPQVVLTFDRLGISGHIDHIVVSLATTFVCQKYKRKLKLFYLCELKKFTDLIPGYFIYFPPGHLDTDIDVTIDISQVWQIKKQAMYVHKTQIGDVRRLLLVKRLFPKREYFIEVFKKDKQKLRSDFFGA